eukprot:CAMPEP_0115866042 /NCGR_PEP_ID=MMETSP0287-20121206/20044_1 /TAXON_ID=412157 /ORGANISM="Chrysochromulina rotalis, Strain UIO044" /LENGTH=122 /DNA_ID=CAMNT_0003320595 /DNA_START=14 /DNA_END=382 /DNA_ORIENTATION=-
MAMTLDVALPPRLSRMMTSTESPWLSGDRTCACGVHHFFRTPADGSDELIRNCILYVQEAVALRHHEVNHAQACRWQMHALGRNVKATPLMSVSFELESTASELTVSVWPVVRDHKGCGDAP